MVLKRRNQLNKQTFDQKFRREGLMIVSNALYTKEKSLLQGSSAVIKQMTSRERPREIGRRSFSTEKELKNYGNLSQQFRTLLAKTLPNSGFLR
jgi:hypothetical protein